MTDWSKIRFKPDGTPDWSALRDAASTYKRVEEEASAADGRVDSQPLSPAVGVEPKVEERPGQSTDFKSLGGATTLQIYQYQRRTITDWLIEAFAPFMVWVMVSSIVFFLLDVRYIYTEVQDTNLRWVAFFFLVGIVALNRVVVRDNSDESILYIIALAGAVGLYTFAMTSEYGGVGSFARGFMNQPGWATLFNMALVAFIWWVTNRLTHECVVDENTSAGDIGILTGTVRQFRKALEPKPLPEPEEIYDPAEWTPEMLRKRRRIRKDGGFTKRLPKRHPGMSIFYFSIPAFVVFALGLRVLQHGGESMVRAGHFFVGAYTAAALMLLMVTSLGGVRYYFKSRNVQLPASLGPFWMGLGTVMVAAVLVAGAALRKPDMPPLAYVDEHETDFWTRGSTFQVQSVAATPVEIIEQSRFMHWLGVGVLTVLGAFFAFSLLRVIAAGIAALGHNREYLPRFVVRFLDGLAWLIDKLTRAPKFPQISLPRRRRVSRHIATCVNYTNPLRDKEAAARMSTADMVVHSYDALCALAEDLGVPREPGQTPYEFLEKFPKPLRTLREEAAELTEFYVNTVYAPNVPDDRIRDRLRKFWHAYEQVRRRAVF